MSTIIATQAIYMLKQIYSRLDNRAKMHQYDSDGDDAFNYWDQIFIFINF